MTPLMQQYHELKSRYPDDILLFRLGDFYEMFNDDARIASGLLDLALTHRQHVPMCGVPAHSADGYIAKLLKAGRRVAIADQMEQPELAKGLVKRSVTRVMTPGTLQEETLLPARRSNYLVGLAMDGSRVGLAAIDCSTGEFLVTETDESKGLSAAWNEITRLNPSEIVLEKSAAAGVWGERLRKSGIAVAEAPPADFAVPVANDRLRRLFGVQTLRGFDLDDKPLAASAAGAALQYLDRTQCGRPYSLRPPHVYALDDFLQMDEDTLHHLDLIEEPGARPTQNLLQTLDQTRTPMGGRLLRRWLLYPLRRKAAIEERQAHMEFHLENKLHRRHVRTLLQGWPDIERIVSRLTAGTILPRDLTGLRDGLTRIADISARLRAAYEDATRLSVVLSPSLKTSLLEFPDELELSRLLRAALSDSPPVYVKDGDVIRPGFNAELDEVRSWIHDGKNRLLDLEKRERDATGIGSLKVGFNNIFGYYIEVTKTHLSRVPAQYIRKQTTAGGERFITPELKEFESRILGSEERALRLEQALLQQLRESILEASEGLVRIAQAIAALDVFTSLAEVAEIRRFVRPIVDESDSLIVREGRHPVLEELLPSGTLVANDTELNGRDRQIVILTGPNMSGKSTYLRQTALIVILAQMGSYVPAAEARIGLVDRLFTRIGASDRLLEGESTFMVEMVETARILNHVTPRSLVILDEVGRGTSTYDGISIAWACLEFLNGKSKVQGPRSNVADLGLGTLDIGPKVLFATHYFELTQLARRLPGVINAHVTAREWGDHVIFLHKVEPGPADRAYGIHVARLAGVPVAVLERAQELLQRFEKSALESEKSRNGTQPPLFPESAA
ncbi:MAG TPA: DNA mismatch repair protein MutS, partial [Elusimicrobiota bacterium]|nr:DNA mismatch repair protein MutS [Elusimicrobiota bacterium]